MRDVTDAFFVPDGDRYVATEHTRGPWSSKHQHGGPPTALIAHVVERTTPGFTIARVSVDFLRPVPIDRLGVRVETLRAGSKVQRLIGTLLHGDTPLAHATVTVVRPAPVDIHMAPDAEPVTLDIHEVEGWDRPVVAGSFPIDHFGPSAGTIVVARDAEGNEVGRDDEVLSP